MVKNYASLWSPNEEIKRNSNLEGFCRHLDKKKFLNTIKIFVICGNGQQKILKFFGPRFGTILRLKV